MLRFSERLRSGIRVATAEDVAVAERRRALLLRRRPGNARVAGRECLPPGVDCRTVRGVSCVVPDRGPVDPRRHGVDVVAEELADEVVLARATRITRRASVQRAERTGRTAGARVRVLHHAY